MADTDMESSTLREPAEDQLETVLNSMRVDATVHVSNTPECVTDAPLRVPTLDSARLQSSVTDIPLSIAITITEHMHFGMRVAPSESGASFRDEDSQAQTVPSLEAITTLVDVLQEASSEYHLVVAILMLERALRDTDCTLRSDNWKCLFLSALMVASKLLDDVRISGFDVLQALSVVSEVRLVSLGLQAHAREPFSLEQLCAAELALMKLLGWRTFIPLDEFHAYARELMLFASEVGATNPPILVPADHRFFLRRGARDSSSSSSSSSSSAPSTLAAPSIGGGKWRAVVARPVPPAAAGDPAAAAAHALPSVLPSVQSPAMNLPELAEDQLEAILYRLVDPLDPSDALAFSGCCHVLHALAVRKALLGKLKKQWIAVGDLCDKLTLHDACEPRQVWTHARLRVETEFEWRAGKGPDWTAADMDVVGWLIELNGLPQLQELTISQHFLAFFGTFCIFAV